ncbi:MarR family winged helix-turn-helix transcriptional regulator [Virgibacillus xinjiangensis]|uniref:MarR family winged helix-turn-helix transcriptional regulator n=1 Tax=Virgibacillus xinjiangensis TaxID=393090 RepID=A0ABV7CWX9_9BACI
MERHEKVTEILYSFREVNKYFYRQMWHHADEMGVTLVQLQIMKLISEEPNMSLGELTQKMNLGKSTVSSTVERLVKAGYLKREQSTEDRRVVILNLTEVGREKQKEGIEKYHIRLQKLGDITDEDAKTLLRLHQMVQEKIKLNGDEEN